MIVFGDSTADAGRRFNAPASFDFEDIGPFPWPNLFEAPDSDVSVDNLPRSTPIIIIPESRTKFRSNLFTNMSRNIYIYNRVFCLVVTAQEYVVFHRSIISIRLQWILSAWGERVERRGRETCTSLSSTSINNNHCCIPASFTSKPTSNISAYFYIHPYVYDMHVYIRTYTYVQTTSIPGTWYVGFKNLTYLTTS